MDAIDGYCPTSVDFGKECRHTALMLTRTDFRCHAPMCTTTMVPVGMALQVVVILQETPH